MKTTSFSSSVMGKSRTAGAGQDRRKTIFKAAPVPILSFYQN